jgi:hypothetical protein
MSLFICQFVYSRFKNFVTVKNVSQIVSEIILIITI